MRVRAKTIRHRIWRRSCRGPPPRPPLSSTRHPPQEVAVTAAPLTPRAGRPGRRASTPASATTSRAADAPGPARPCGRLRRRRGRGRAVAGTMHRTRGRMARPDAGGRGRRRGRPPRPLSGPRTGGGTQHGPTRRADSRSGCRSRPVGVARRPSIGCTRRTPALSRAARGSNAPQEGAPRMTPCTGATMVAASHRAGFQPTKTRAGDGITGPCRCCGGTDRVWIGSLPDGGQPWMAWSHGCSCEDMRSTLGRDASGHANGGGPGHTPVSSSTDEAGTPVFEVERRRAAGGRGKQFRPRHKRRTTRSCGRSRQPAGAWSPPSRP